MYRTILVLLLLLLSLSFRIVLHCRGSAQCDYAVSLSILRLHHATAFMIGRTTADFFRIHQQLVSNGCNRNVRNYSTACYAFAIRTLSH